MNKNNFHLDRFEGKYAVLIDEEANKLDILRKDLPESAREGDTLRFENGRYVIDAELTQKRKASITSRFERLKKKKQDLSPEGESH